MRECQCWWLLCTSLLHPPPSLSRRDSSFDDLSSRLTDVTPTPGERASADDMVLPFSLFLFLYSTAFVCLRVHKTRLVLMFFLSFFSFFFWWDAIGCRCAVRHHKVMTGRSNKDGLVRHQRKDEKRWEGRCCDLTTTSSRMQAQQLTDWCLLFFFSLCLC